MMNHRKFFLTLFFVVVAVNHSCLAKKSKKNTYVNDIKDCSIWMARSSTSSGSEPKIGLYAGRDYDEGSVIGKPEVAIPLFDFIEPYNRRSDMLDAILIMLEGYMWTGEFGGVKFEGRSSNTAFIPGFGVLANYHSGMNNVDWEHAAVLLREPMVLSPAGVSNPSRGALSNYYNLTMKAVTPIKAGMELFANFGDVWDDPKATENVYQDRLTRGDYVEADEVLEKILEFMNKYEAKMTPKLKDDVLDFIMNKVLGTAAGSRAKVVRSLIPAHPGKLQTVKDMGGTFAYRNQDLVKTDKWLRKHGVCVDSLEIKPSTIRSAGRGAFMTRKIKKGGVVMPVPLLHVPDSSVFELFELIEQHDEAGNVHLTINPERMRGHQLAINYCFGHPESSMVLMPVAPAVTQINHAQSSKANAKLVWSKNKVWGNENSWLDLAPGELLGEDHNYIGLVMEIQALRDIEPGEEVFIDYGKDWLNAWEKHKKMWNARFRTDQSWPLQADDMKLTVKTAPYKTMEEQEVDPYPKGVDTACFLYTDDMHDGFKKRTDDGKDIYIFVGPLEYEEYKSTNFFRCNVTAKSDLLDDGNFYNYTVRAIPGKKKVVEIVDVPHRAITFIDIPHSSDIHAAGVFRHWIGVPDVIWPQAWRDRRG